MPKYHRFILMIYPTCKIIQVFITALLTMMDINFPKANLATPTRSITMIQISDFSIQRDPSVCKYFTIKNIPNIITWVCELRQKRNK